MADPMNELTLQERQLIMLLSGDDCVEELKSAAAGLHASNPLVWKIKSVIAIREGRPAEALKKCVKRNSRFSHILQELAKKHMDLDASLVANGIRPPPPASRAALVPTTVSDIFTVPKKTRGGFGDLTDEIRKEVRERFKAAGGPLLEQIADDISTKYSVEKKHVVKYIRVLKALKKSNERKKQMKLHENAAEMEQ